MNQKRAHTQAEAAAGSLPLVTGMLFFVPIVLLGNEVGTVLRYPELGSAVLFPPYAVLTAALVASARRHWGWYIIVAAIAHAVASLPHWSLAWVLLADVANIARALVAAIMLRQLLGSPPRLDGVRALNQFFVSAVLVAPAVGASIGAANVAWLDASSTYWRTWAAWFSSNALTGLIMLPGLLVATRLFTPWRHTRIEPLRLVEAIALTLALAGTCTGAFLLRVPSSGVLTWLLYAPLPLLMWAAMRFGQGGASLALTAVAGAAIWAADQGTGPFSSRSTDDNVLALQLFMLLTAVPVLCIAAIGGARRGAVELYRALLASLQDHVAILDARGIVLEVNDSWRRFAGGEHDCPLDRVRAGDDYLAACREALVLLQHLGRTDDTKVAPALAGAESVLSGACRRCEVEYEQGDDATREWYTIRMEALERPDGGVVVTRSNVSARHRAQIEIEERRREVTYLARLSVLGQLSGALAHELRQPLSSILANAEAGQRLLQRQPLDIGELSEILRDIATDDQRAAQVIAGLRSLLKRGMAHVRPVDAESLLLGVLALARAELLTRRVTVTTDVQPGLPKLLADAVQVQQVLLNLILNACEAMSDVPIADRKLLVTAATTDAGDVRFSIRDAGAGIPPALIERLFDPFVTTKPEGLGLGLSIARTIVAAHGGRIWAENNASGGATIHCELVSVPTNAAPTPMTRAFADASAS
jgi:two-component system, LuxR family, sensor kinase FixL